MKKQIKCACYAFLGVLGLSWLSASTANTFAVQNGTTGTNVAVILLEGHSKTTMLAGQYWVTNKKSASFTFYAYVASPQSCTIYSYNFTDLSSQQNHPYISVFADGAALFYYLGNGNWGRSGVQGSPAPMSKCATP